MNIPLKVPYNFLLYNVGAHESAGLLGWLLYVDNEWLARAFRLLNDFPVTGAAIQQQHLKKVHLISYFCERSERVFLSMVTHWGALESTSFCFLTLHSPLTWYTFSLVQRSPLAQLPSPSVGPYCTLYFYRLQNKMTPNRAHFWVGN